MQMMYEKFLISLYYIFHTAFFQVTQLLLYQNVQIITYLIAFLLSQALTTVFADYEMDYPNIRQFIYWVETDNRVALSKHVEYPLSRSHPIPT